MFYFFTFKSNLKSFLLQRANENEIVALCLYWFVKVEIKDNKTSNPNSNTGPSSSSSSTNLSSLNNSDQAPSNNNLANNQSTTNTNNNSNDSKSNFQIFMDELLDNLRTGDGYARSIYESIINQEKFLKSLNDVVKATGRESGGRDKKVVKLRQFLTDTTKSSNTFDLIDFHQVRYAAWTLCTAFCECGFSFSVGGHCTPTVFE